MSCPFPLSIPVPRKTLPLLWFLSSLWLSWPLKPRLHRQTQELKARAHIYLNSTVGWNSLFWELLSNCHINRSEKKSLFSRKQCWSAAASFGNTSAPRPPHPHPLSAVSVVSPSVMGKRIKDFTDTEDFQLRGRSSSERSQKNS